jgi:hypothetical protein
MGPDIQENQANYQERSSLEPNTWRPTLKRHRKGGVACKKQDRIQLGGIE